MEPEPDEIERAKRDIAQMARELAPESTQEEFLEAFGLGNVCERCGRRGLDDDGYTDCDLVPDPDDPQTFGLLLCHECKRAEHAP